jgi:hypothetical protein
MYFIANLQSTSFFSSDSHTLDRFDNFNSFPSPSFFSSHHSIRDRIVCSEELALVRYNTAVLQDGITLWLIECARASEHRPVKRIETMAPDPGHDPKEANAQSTRAERPE